MTTSAPGFELTLRGDFESLGPSRTRHVLTGEAQVGGMRGLLGPVMRRKFGRDIKENLRRIKALMEAEPTG